MLANEMFQVFTQGCLEVSEIINEEIRINGSNDDIAVLQAYLQKTKIEGKVLVLPEPFNSVQADDKMKIAVFLTEYICGITFLAFKVFNHRQNLRTGDIFSKLFSMKEQLLKGILELE